MRLSETTLRIRDEERQELIEEARRAAQKMIVAQRSQLDALAHELLEHEVLEREAIERIMSGVPRLERAPGVGLRVVAAAPYGPPAGSARSTLHRRAWVGRRARVAQFADPHAGRGRGRGWSAAGRLRGMFDRIDHVGVAVQDIDASLDLYRDLFELDVAHREVVQEQGVEAVLLDVGENHVELLAPLGADTPVGRFLAKQGPGLHHVAYQVSDIDSTLAALTARGYGR